LSFSRAFFFKAKNFIVPDFGLRPQLALGGALSKKNAADKKGIAGARAS